MRAVVQRVTRASVTVDNLTVAEIGSGLLVLVGITHTDSDQRAAQLARKIWELRILADERSAAEVGAGILVVSQFTLYADTRKGRRPSWSAAAPSAVSQPLYESFCSALASCGARVEQGVFGASMQVALVNDGPVTVIVEV